MNGEKMISCGHNGPNKKVEVCDGCKDAPRIFVFLNGGSRGLYHCVGIAEDGEVLAGHGCSHEGFVPHDLGVTSDWKHVEYRKKYPKGFRVEYVEHKEVPKHEALQKAFKLNDELAKKEKTKS